MNDTFRLDPQRWGRLFLTAGIVALGQHHAVKTFGAFTPADDPHSEHDFINVEVDGVKVFAKIDYYGPTMQSGSDDPSDQTNTTHVMTIMLADEY